MMNPAINTSRISALEKIVLIHVAVLLLGSTWACGGNVGWARLGLSIWGSLALPITAFIFLNKPALAPGVTQKQAWWLLPVALYASLVIASCFNPSFQNITFAGQLSQIHRGPAHPHLPNTVNPADSLKSLWFGAGAYLSAFNLSLVIRNRSVLHRLLAFAACNTLALSVYGTLQKLSGAGYYFGSVVSPNKRYFSTFIYNNHWGAFAIMMLAVTAGLLFYQIRRNRDRDLWNSPFTGILLSLLIIAATAPISASRAATGMTVALLVIVVIHAMARIIISRRRLQISIWPPLLILVSSVTMVTMTIGWLGYRSIHERYTDTLAALNSNDGLLEGRIELYRDTWELAMRKPVFGWGLNSYATAFQLVRPSSIQPQRQYEAIYANAHSDWLQSLTETGFVGTALLILALVLPLRTLPRSQLSHPLVIYPLMGLGAVLLYAWVEFPFASGAVVIAFWTLLFSALRFAKLTALASHSRQ